MVRSDGVFKVKLIVRQDSHVEDVVRIVRGTDMQPVRMEIGGAQAVGLLVRIIRDGWMIVIVRVGHPIEHVVLHSDMKRRPAADPDGGPDGLPVVAEKLETRRGVHIRAMRARECAGREAEVIDALEGRFLGVPEHRLALPSILDLRLDAGRRVASRPVARAARWLLAGAAPTRKRPPRRSSMRRMRDRLTDASQIVTTLDPPPD